MYYTIKNNVFTAINDNNLRSISTKFQSCVTKNEIIFMRQVKLSIGVYFVILEPVRKYLHSNGARYSIRKLKSLLKIGSTKKKQGFVTLKNLR